MGRNHPAVRLYQGDCLDVMPCLEAGSIDMVLCDLPYGTTQCSWDSVIPFEPLWREYRRLCSGVAALTAVQPFASALVMSNPKGFRYEWAWDKRVATGSLNAKRQPMRAHESVLIFAEHRGIYNPQMVERSAEELARLTRSAWKKPPASAGGVYGARQGASHPARQDRGRKPPTTVIRISGLNGCHPERKGVGHPTQKPVALLEYLIRTYTNEGDTVLDNCAGSGSTAVACINTGRRCVAIERDPAYFAVAERRIRTAEDALRAPRPEPAPDLFSEAAE